MSERSVLIDRYIVDVLMRDLVGHDRVPSAFLVYLFLFTRQRISAERAVRISLRTFAEETGLSKSAVQTALEILKRRRLITSRMAHSTATPIHVVHRPWAKVDRALRAR